MAKLNPQGLARRSPEIMTCILPNPKTVLVSIDLSAGEPTVTSHFSQDPNYMYACFDGVGKAPYYSAAGVLMIDDIYLMVMSVSPIGKDKMQALFNKTWAAGSFVEQWLHDSEVIKTHCKKDRQIHKILALGLGYGMGAQKMVKQMYDSGFLLSIEDAKAFKNAYWRLFKGVKLFAETLSKEIDTKGFMVNPFGYRLTPDPHKAFNYFIQSSVSGIMHVFSMKLFSQAPYAKFITCIHDELIVEVPEDKAEQFQRDKELATDSLNTDLNWTVKIRTGFVVGRNWYEAK